MSEIKIHLIDSKLTLTQAKENEEQALKEANDVQDPENASVVFAKLIEGASNTDVSTK